ncbi:MAG: beta-glucosidase [Spirochaetes bacterium]|nr:beta-glucosidase [Spirochaetota bacterium]MBU1079483.1 beta-glucosidase [Spirochaetota bacterium]
MRSFSKDFIFGASSSAFQIEGSPEADGKGPSIWDEFAARPKAARGGSGAKTACDHYRRWEEDVGIASELGLDAYRFSVSWPRVMPEGKGRVNRAGIDFYSRLVDGLLERGVRPFPTLFHWDLPLALQRGLGGFQSRDVAFLFADYAAELGKALGDRVKDWITINEPFEFACFGHLFGTHAPGVKNPFAYLPALHHQLLGHGLAVGAVRAEVPGGRIGVALSWTPVHPARTAPSRAAEADAAAAARTNAFMNEISFAPILKKAYPALVSGGRILRAPIRPGDLDVIGAPLDFVGLNYYSRERARNNPFAPLIRADVTGKEPRELPETDGRTAMGWEVYHDGIAEILEDLRVDYGNPPVIMTEFGSAWTDEVEIRQLPPGTGPGTRAGKRVRDSRRARYLRDALGRMHEAMARGSDLRGAFVWSLTDNFEWAEGNAKRFGLVHVDYATQERVVKDSGLWYARMIAARDLDAVPAEGDPGLS